MGSNLLEAFFFSRSHFTAAYVVHIAGYVFQLDGFELFHKSDKLSVSRLLNLNRSSLPLEQEYSAKVRIGTRL